MEKMAFGESIKFFRKLNGMNQEELSERIGVAQQTISSWESGNSYPDVEAIERLCECFGISEGILFDKGRELSRRKSISKKAIIKGAIGIIAIVGMIFVSSYLFKNHKNSHTNGNEIHSNYVSATPEVTQSASQSMVDKNRIDNYDELYRGADLIVVGTFEGDATAKLIKEYDSSFGKEVVVNASAANTFTIDKVIKGNESIEKVTIVQRYGYDEENNKLITFSDMTPMEKGTKWVYFLKHNEGEDTYYSLGDSDGRYPADANLAEMLESDASEKEICEKFGVYSRANIKENIYKEVVSKILKY